MLLQRSQTQTFTSAYRNKKSWIDSILFEERVQDLDKKFTKLKKKIALIIDNFPAHRKINDITFIELIFVPPNTISKLQSMDEGVIWSLKAYFKSLGKIPNRQGRRSSSSFWKSFIWHGKKWKVPPSLTVLWKQEFRKSNGNLSCLYPVQICPDPSKDLQNKVEKFGNFYPPRTTAEDVILADENLMNTVFSLRD